MFLVPFGLRKSGEVWGGANGQPGVIRRLSHFRAARRAVPRPPLTYIIDALGVSDLCRLCVMITLVNQHSTPVRVI